MTDATKGEFSNYVFTAPIAATPTESCNNLLYKIEMLPKVKINDCFFREPKNRTSEDKSERAGLMVVTCLDESLKTPFCVSLMIDVENPNDGIVYLTVQEEYFKLA